MDEARAKLQKLVEQLRSYPSSPITGEIELAEFAAKAFERYLTGEVKTLDAAFRLKRGRGAPKTKTTEHEEIARLIFQMRLSNKSWKKIADELYDSVDVSDERTLRRIYDDCFVKVASEEMVRRLNSEDGA